MNVGSSIFMRKNNISQGHQLLARLPGELDMESHFEMSVLLLMET